MPVSSETLRMLMDAGLSGDALLEVVASIDADHAARSKVRTAGAIRQERYRQRKASQTVTGDVTNDVTDLPSPEGSSPTPPSPKPLPTIPPSPPKGGSSPIDRAFSVFAEHAERAGIPTPRKATADRRRKIEARLREHGEQAWAEACRKMAESSFCRGSNDRGWRADLDFVCQPKSFNGLIEGKYDDRKPASAPAPVGRDGRPQIRLSMDTPDADRARYFIATGSWSKWWGYPPGDEDCSLPKTLIRQCLEARRIAA